MTAREWLYSELTQEPLSEGRVFAKKSMTSSIELHPFIVYKLGVNANEDLAETSEVNRQYVQIYVHDYSDKETGDYGRIDEVVKWIKRRLMNGNDPQHKVISALYLETSQDLSDDTLNTVMKYIRFQLILEE